MERDYGRRIGYQGKLEEISLAICKDLCLGNFVKNKLILTGYEDYNFILETTNGKYFVKVFANSKTIGHCNRYINVMKTVLAAGVKTPKLIKNGTVYLNKLKLNDANLRFCLLEYISGKDLFSLSKTLVDDEIRSIVNQAALINSIDIKPPFIYDPWAITNFKKEFKKKSKHLSTEDLSMLKLLIEEFDILRIHELPRCFVHGDLVRTNIMKDNNGEIWIIDFSVSNYYPRIQELSVLASDLLFDPKSKEESERRYNIAIREYQKKCPLIKTELTALRTYIKLAFAMHILLTSYEKANNQNSSKENEYYLRLGRAGLKQMA